VPPDGDPEIDGEGIDPIIKTSPDEDILRKILELLNKRIELGLCTLFAKIKSHRGEFFNKMVDRWADKGRPTEMEARWTNLRQRPTFTLTALGKTRRSTVSKVVKTRAHLMAARLQIPDHDNLTAQCLKRKGNCRLGLGDYRKNKQVSVNNKRRLLQSISFKFPYDANFKKWGWLEDYALKRGLVTVPRGQTHEPRIGSTRPSKRYLQHNHQALQSLQKNNGPNEWAPIRKDV